MEKCFWLVQGVNAYKEIISLKAQIKKKKFITTVRPISII